MKKTFLAISLLLITISIFTGCSESLTETTITGDWFCQLGEDGGLLENEYDFELKSDGSYIFTYIYKALGILDTKNSGKEYGDWAYDEDSKELTFSPNSGDKYSFTIETLTYPKTRLYWTDNDDVLDTSGFDGYSDNVFTFDLYEE
ncbi:MAG: hypothetical protein PQJ46_04800 [Spirochaetales bacterium]|nr:hypothetical protein [Spirochaetales bacterium]